MGGISGQPSLGKLYGKRYRGTVQTSQYKLSLANDDSTPTAFGQTLIHLNTFFTWGFTLELLLNLYAHWKGEFVKDGWNNFDLVVVAWGHIELRLPGDVKIHILIFRLLRVFRVLLAYLGN